jgi:aspartate carbamoyltransferase catalytic subunit
MARVYEEALASAAVHQSGSVMDLISIKDLSLAQINLILETAARFKTQSPKHLLDDKIIANCFFEPSTRTRLSFETAALRMGAKVIGFSSAESLSIQKGETLSDTIRIVSDYADLLVMRHPKEGAARLAANISDKPVINAGDGANQHPSQALVDLFTIKECQQRLDGLAIALVGDLKYGRTIHSFIQACVLFDVRLFLVAPDSLTLPPSLCDNLKKQGVRFSFHQSLEEVIAKVDILYMTRIQQERFSGAEYQHSQHQYIVTPAMLTAAKANLKILHPLPRVNEIDFGVDSTPYAHYFQQAANGICVRQAILAMLLKELS